MSYWKIGDDCMNKEYEKLYSDTFCDLQDMENGFAWYSDISLFAFPIPIDCAEFIAKKLKEDLKQGLKLIDFMYLIYKKAQWKVPMEPQI